MAETKPLLSTREALIALTISDVTFWRYVEAGGHQPALGGGGKTTARYWRRETLWAIAADHELTYIEPA